MKVEKPEKKRIIYDRSQVVIHTLGYNNNNNSDAKDIKNLVETEVKSPKVKRRFTVQNVT